MGTKNKKKLLLEILGIFECLLTQNLTNQDSYLFLFFHTKPKAVSKSKNRGLLVEVIFASK